MPLEPIKTRDKANFKLSDGFEVTLRRFVDAQGTVGYSLLVSGTVVDKTDGAAVLSFSGEDLYPALTATQQTAARNLMETARTKAASLLATSPS